MCGADMGAVIYSSGMCVDCYKEYLENAGGQLQGHNPPAYTQGLIKASKQQVGLLLNHFGLLALVSILPAAQKAKVMCQVEHVLVSMTRGASLGSCG